MPPRLNLRLATIATRPIYRTLAVKPNISSITAANRLADLKSQFSSTANMSDLNQHNQSFKLENLFSVKDRVALITGGGSGIGLMATQALATNGAKVYICGRTGEKLDKVAEKYGKDIPGQIIPIQADVSRKDSIRDLVKEIQKREKCLCILINNAGIELNTQKTEAESTKEMSKNLFEDENETFELWADTFKTNAAQIFFMTTAFLPLLQNASEMHKGYSGTVINITSISGTVKTAQHHFAYNTSKAAAIHLNTMLSNEVAMNGFKVRINAVAPGVFPSEMTAGESGEDQKSHIPKEKYESKTPARRPGKDEDMANAILFAATNQYLNGQNVIVDGGYVIQAGGGP
jgi:NAD(P)-dependent dehydrogenase (short-subunit alcohol dehydrogenase family)